MHVPSRRADFAHRRDRAAVDANLGGRVAALAARVRSTKCETDAMLGSASPRNPSVLIAPRSSGVAILLVACRSTARRASSRLHPLAIVLDANQLLAAELDGDRDATRAGVERVLDQLLDDRRRPLDDFAGGDLVGEVQREAGEFAPRQIQRRRRNKHSIDRRNRQHHASRPTRTAQARRPGSCGSVTFMPHMPGEHRERHEDRRDDRQHLHDAVQLVRHGRQVRVEQAR